MIPSSPDFPKSVPWLSIDDLIPQPPPPGGRGAPISLRSGLEQEFNCRNPQIQLVALQLVP